jgi:hypothetical protein
MKERRYESVIFSHIFTTTFPLACLLITTSYACVTSQYTTPQNSIKYTFKASFKSQTESIGTFNPSSANLETLSNPSRLAKPLALKYGLSTPPSHLGHNVLLIIQPTMYHTPKKL